MIKVFYGMRDEDVQAFTEAKTDLITARKAMKADDVAEAKDEIVRTAQIYDIADDDDETSGELYTINDSGEAIIPIKGMLVQKVDICSAFFAQNLTTYRFIEAAVNQANEDPRVSSIALDINSGGGVVNGVDSAFRTIKKSKKPVTSYVKDMAASAAYWLASGSDKIVAMSKTGFYGSIGVAVEIINRDKMDEEQGIKRVVLTNRESRDKRPDEASEGGQAIIQDELDAIYNVFVSSILESRSAKLDVKKISGLRGKVLIAQDAVDYGLVDEAIFTNKAAPVIVSGKNDKEDSVMSLTDYLKENPEAAKEYNKMVAKDVAAGVEKDRERSTKILGFAGGSVPEKIVNAIGDGTTAEEYAVSELTEQRKKRASADDDMGELLASSSKQVPDTSGKSDEQKKVDAFDKMLEVGGVK